MSGAEDESQDHVGAVEDGVDMSSKLALMAETSAEPASASIKDMGHIEGKKVEEVDEEARIIVSAPVDAGFEDAEPDGKYEKQDH